MSAIVAAPSVARGGLVPRGARLGLLAVILGLHAAALFKLSAAIPVTPLPSIAIDFAPLPEIARPPAATPDPAPVMAESEASPPVAEPEPAAVVEMTPPEVVAPPPEPEPAPPPKVEAKPFVEPPPKPRSTPKPSPKPVVAPRAEPRKPAIATSAPARAATPPAGGPAAPAMSTATYAALVAGELNRHKTYPESARAVGASGSVGVAFTIGPSGRATAITITSGSGNAALDGAARQAVASIRAPPPPGGVFRTATTIRFSLR